MGFAGQLRKGHAAGLDGHRSLDIREPLGSLRVALHKLLIPVFRPFLALLFGSPFPSLLIG